MSERTAQDALRDAEEQDALARTMALSQHGAGWKRARDHRIEAAGYRCEAVALAILASPPPCPHPRWRDAGRDHDYHGNNNHIRYQRCDQCGMERRVS